MITSSVSLHQRVCDLSLLSSATKEIWEVYSNDLVSVIKVAHELPAPMICALLSRISSQTIPTSAITEQLVSVLKRYGDWNWIWSFMQAVESNFSIPFVMV